MVQAHPEAPKKESCKSMIYGTLLFLTFQICSQIVSNIILFVAIQRFIFAESVATNPAKENLCRVLSSSNVDKLKMLMGFQLSTAGFQRKMKNNSRYAERLHRGIVPLHPKTNGSMAEW